MKLDKLQHDPSALVDFYAEGLEALGAVCDRTWYDRVQLVAEGRAATLWNREGALLDTELHFLSADETGARQAERDVFPGCPLTFHLAELLRPHPLPLDRAVLNAGDHRPPASEVVEKLWRQQFPETSRWQLRTEWQRGWHFLGFALMRCEVQAIDQHWSLHRVAISLADGSSDESFAAGLDFTQLDPHPTAVPWPTIEPARWQEWLLAALQEEIAPSLGTIQRRQETYLRREFERIDDYYQSYERELRGRVPRSSHRSARLKLDERLAAARAEHARRRGDQVQRHEIRVIAHLDALLLLAEPAWQAEVTCLEHHVPRAGLALFVPRARRWHFPWLQQSEESQ